MDHEYACTADDIIWRRSKLGLRLTQEEVASLEHWMQTEGLTQRALAS
jgi:glycerol-3-phosphate dehydrogenase